MFIIAGLGNPTDRYTNTRHNAGFRVIDELAKRNNIPLNTKKFNAVCGNGVIGGIYGRPVLVSLTNCKW